MIGINPFSVTIAHLRLYHRTIGPRLDEFRVLVGLTFDAHDFSASTPANSAL